VVPGLAMLPAMPKYLPNGQVILAAWSVWLHGLSFHPARALMARVHPAMRPE